jgi:hypothetical protein
MTRKFPFRRRSNQFENTSFHPCIGRSVDVFAKVLKAFLQSIRWTRQLKLNFPARGNSEINWIVFIRKHYYVPESGFPLCVISEMIIGLLMTLFISHKAKNNVVSYEKCYATQSICVIYFGPYLCKGICNLEVHKRLTTRIIKPIGLCCPLNLLAQMRNYVILALAAWHSGHRISLKNRRPGFESRQGVSF